MSYKVNKALQFSQRFINGSPKKKKEMVTQYNDKIYEGICSHITEGDSFRSCDALNEINSVLPEKKRIDIKNLQNKFIKNYDGGSDYIYDKNDNIIGQTLELPIKKGKIKGKDLPTFMHELTHILDVFVNPKYNVRATNCEIKGLYGKKYDKVYDKLYNVEKYSNESEKAKIIEERKEEVLNFLQGKPVEDKMDCIQDLRYSLETEQNAYREQLRFARKTQTKNIEVEPNDLIEYEDKYLFTEKLQMLKEIGLDIVKKQRNKLQKKHK